MEGCGWKQAPVEKIHVESYASGGRLDLRRECLFVICVNGRVKCAEVLLHLLVEGIQLLFHNLAVNIECGLCCSKGYFHGVVLTPRLAVIAAAKLRSREEGLGGECRRLVGLCFDLFLKSFQRSRELFRHCEPTVGEAIFDPSHAFHSFEFCSQALKVCLPGSELLRAFLITHRRREFLDWR